MRAEHHFSRHFSYVREGHLSSLEVNYGTFPLQKVSAQKTCCLFWQWAHQECWVYSENATVFSPLISSRSITPCGFCAVPPTSLLDTSGWSTVILEPVSKTKDLGTPSISTETLGVPGSNDRNRGDPLSALSRALGRKELS